MVGKWFLLKALVAIIAVVLAGAAVEALVRDMRLKTGPHDYFVVSSSYGYYGGRRGGRAYQRDSVVAGPFKTAGLCSSELRSNWKSVYGMNYYCEDLLLSDAAATDPQIILPPGIP